MVGSYRAPLADLEFLLQKVMPTQQLLELPAFAHVDRDDVTAVLEQGARFSEEVLAPANFAGDAVGSRIDGHRVVLPDAYHNAWARYVEDGWLGLDLPQAFGGQGLPRMLQAGFAEMANGACLAFCMLPLMCRAGARLLREHAAPEIVARFVPKLTAGEWAATICISEPQAGSDVGRIQARAEPEDDGTYRLSGNKIWISYGDHELTPQIAHLVLARTPGAPPGTRGLSLFLVPKRRLAADGRPAEANAVRALSIEHKMGLKASPTCVMEFDRALAYRIGPAGRGLRCMFTMVNTMRLEVAIQGHALGGAATARAIDYATERRQGGDPDQQPVPIIEHPDVQRMLLTMRAKTEAARGLALEAALQLDLAEHAVDESRRLDAAALAGWLLPICKAYGTDTGFEVTNLAVQVFGGYGYVTETGIEQYVRDLRVSAIYEGTNGIQALDLVLRKLLKDGGERLGLFLGRIRSDLDRHASEKKLDEIRDGLIDAVETLERCSRTLLQKAAEPRPAAAAATPYLRLAGLVGYGWMWLRMAAAATGRSPLHKEKRLVARFFARHLMPEALTLEAQILAAAAELEAPNLDVLSTH